MPVDTGVAQALAARYHHPAVGDARIVRLGQRLRFDFGGWSSEMASLCNPDGTDSLITVEPGAFGFEFLVGRRDGKRTLLPRDAQHRYELVEAE